MGSKTLIISGLSGAGKSLAIKNLEDMGFYCVDNLPTPLVEPFFNLIEDTFLKKFQKLALVIDARDKEFIRELPQKIKNLKKDGKVVEVLFFETSDDVLVRRFSETRHRHPLSPKGSVLEGIQKERELLAPIKEFANQIIDTSVWSSQDLKTYLSGAFEGDQKSRTLNVAVVSFGFRYGVPQQADLVFDVRFIKNPYFEEKLKSKTGEDAEVKKFVLNQKDTEEFLVKTTDLISFLIPRYQAELKSYLTLAIGCTGGQHRSVAIAREIAQFLQKKGLDVSLSHRDMNTADQKRV